MSSSHHDALNVSGIGLRERGGPETNDDSPVTDGDDRAFDITQFLLKMMKEDSPFFQNNTSSTLPRFEANEVSLEKNLGQGEFGVVFSIKAIRAEGVKDDAIVAPESNSNCTLSTHEETEVAGDPDHEEAFPKSSPSERDDDAHPPSVKVYLDCQDISLNEEGLKILREPNVSKGYMSAHAIRSGIPRYAIKRLRKDLKGSVLVQATADLAAEANFLMSLYHPNICRMRGTIGEPGKKGFAIVLDRLTMTLRQKMMEWKKQDPSSVSLLQKAKSKVFSNKSKQVDMLEVGKYIYREKLMAVYDIARALRHLAENSVIYRDLKPENIGIDLRGDLRLFDFGLAKELKEKDMISPGMYKLTGMTGSRRYMAPEVIQSKNYGLSADVYGYSILFWEVMSNRNAYSYLTLEKHYEMVVQRKKRPDLKKMVSKKVLPPDSNIHNLVKKCWSHKPLDRPSIETVCETLSPEMLETSSDEDEINRTKHLTFCSLRSRVDDEECYRC